ncbi:MAG: DegV family protein [Desulfosudaceae bacterium]
MMITKTPEAFIAGYERLSAWSDILDRINIFPVADGDTGRNLIVSLSPLREIGNRDINEIRWRLLLAARGNAGNIAVQFITELLASDDAGVAFGDDAVALLCRGANAGVAGARQAVGTPRDGTMLTVLDEFAEALESLPEKNDSSEIVEPVMDRLEAAVHSTTDLLPELQAADVVDAGALGMFLFLEGFLKKAFAQKASFRSVHDIFGDRLRIDPSFEKSEKNGYCVDFVVRVDGDSEQWLRQIEQSDDSVMAYKFQDYAKIHLHTGDSREMKQKAERMGRIIHWTEDSLLEQTKDFNLPARPGPIHIITDAAGSLSRDLARRLGVTLLDSYITFGDRCLPETRVSPDELYRAMRDKVNASTSQASVFERHQHYQRLLDQHERLLYLCVGSVYTGNYRVVMEWKKRHDPDNRLTVIDTGAASGRLAGAVIATAEYAARAREPDQVVEFAERAVVKSKEYIFLDELKYLAAGGRMSKAGAFVGDFLHLKPVVTPTARGAEKVGLVRHTEAQVRFALDRLAEDLRGKPTPLILLEYSDNRHWLEERVLTEVKRLFPAAEIVLQPLSLTSGVHIGPGAWAVACYGD